MHGLAGLNQNAVHQDGIRGRCGFLNYLRRDATALGLRLLSMLDITSSFQRIAICCDPPQWLKYDIA